MPIKSKSILHIFNCEMICIIIQHINEFKDGFVVPTVFHSLPDAYNQFLTINQCIK